jgi:hypothetical protein
MNQQFYQMKKFLICCVAFFISATSVFANNITAASNSTTQAMEKDPNYGPIPGPRDCFWTRGPHSADPYINLAYPDSSVFYWSAVFSIPKGSKLNIHGEFAHARYQSFISYDERGRPIESLTDYLIEPDKGSVNPYRNGAERNSGQRQYSIEILDQKPEQARAIGAVSHNTSSNVLHAPAYGNGQQSIIYRIYLPDAGKWPTGGVSLPKFSVTTATGQTLSGEAGCQALKSSQPLQVTLDAVGIPPVEYRKLLNIPGKPDTWPAEIPAKWYIQLDRPSLIGIYTGEISENARRSEGGFFPNLDNQYVRTIVNRKHGKVFMVRGKMPSIPKTFHGDVSMGEGELRYWSLCSNQGFANTRVNDCLYDEEVPLDANGFYTVMVSRAEDRPRNAVKECGIAWLPMAEDGDGMFDEDVTVVQIRNMLAAADFKHSITNVDKQADLESIMGPYMPKTRYLQPNQVETFFPCLPES